MLIRYADDFVCAFQYQKDAQRFYRALKHRLNKFSLKLAPDKSRILRFSRHRLSHQRRICFLGFELNWGRDRNGQPHVQRRTARTRLQRALQRIKDWIKVARHLPGAQFVSGLKRRLQGHYNYYGLNGNSRSLGVFYTQVMQHVLKWLNRRGGKRRSHTWASFKAACKRLEIPKPRITETQRRHVVYA